jgi:hypothetical protein
MLIWEDISIALRGLCNDFAAAASGIEADFDNRTHSQEDADLEAAAHHAASC